MKMVWKECPLCRGARFIKTPSGYWLCQMCEGDSGVLIDENQKLYVPENLIRDIQEGKIK